MLVSRLLLAVACCTAITAESRDVYYQGALAPRSIGPTFDKGYLVVYDRDHKIDVYAPDGSPLYSVSAHVPKADWVNFENAAVDTDGTLAGAVACGRGNSIAGAGIVLFEPHRTPDGVLRYRRVSPHTDFVCSRPLHLGPRLETAAQRPRKPRLLHPAELLPGREGTRGLSSPIIVRS